MQAALSQPKLAEDKLGDSTGARPQRCMDYLKNKQKNVFTACNSWKRSLEGKGGKKKKEKTQNDNTEPHPSKKPARPQTKHPNVFDLLSYCKCPVPS